MEHDYSYAESLQKVLIETPNGSVECVGASYNGVSFFVDSASISGGRNVVTKSLPFSTEHVNEDTGIKVREFSVSFYLIGENVESQRETLEEAFNKEGAFEFIHPYYGKFKARCTAYSLDYTKNDQEYVSGSASFVPETEIKNSGKSQTDFRSETIQKSNKCLKKSKSIFEKVFDLVKKAKSVVDDVQDFTNDVLDKIEDARSSIRSVSAFVQNISQIRDNIQSILMTPKDFSSRIQNLLTMTKETVDDDGGFNDYVNESLVIIQNQNGSKKSGNLSANEMNDAISRLVVMSAAAMSCRCLVDSTFNSTDEAERMQNDLENAFEIALENTDNFDDYSDLLDMKASALKYLRETISNLAVVVDLPLLKNRDILSVCFDCYGSLEKLEDILNRNKIQDPAIINRKSLKVLSK